MKVRKFLVLATLACLAPAAKAQYIAAANQISSLLGPALSGSFNYKGFVELSGVAGLGENRANFAEISTSQGFTYSSWFFMGAGMGIAVAHSTADFGKDYQPGNYSQTKAMIPIFTDFRFFLGNTSSIGGYIDIKLGAAWMIGRSYLCTSHGYLTNAAQFYCKPSVGIRIPTGKGGRQAFDIGLTYQLITSDNYYSWNNSSISLSNLGLTLGYEW